MELTAPAVADHEVAPAEVNCCVAPTATVATPGEIVCAALPTRFTVAVAYPNEPTTVTVTVGVDGIVDGAV